jgi:hypothetical protein
MRVGVLSAVAALGVPEDRSALLQAYLDRERLTGRAEGLRMARGAINRIRLAHQMLKTQPAGDEAQMRITKGK